MEHVLCSHLSKHLEINNILTPHQHGFRKGFSSETQLISVLDDWLSSLDKQTRTDVLSIDFSKAFDSVPHQRLLPKLNYYGITGDSLSHAKSVKHKAMRILGLLRRNFSGSSQYFKTQAYNSLVRPHVEYASAAWSPFEKQHINYEH